MSRCAQAAEVEALPKIDAALELTTPADRAAGVRTTEPMAVRIHSPEEEIALGRTRQLKLIVDRLSHISQLHPTPHAPCAVFHLVTMLIGG